MRFEKVLLVNMKSGCEDLLTRPPLGIGYLAEALLKKDIQYNIMDMCLKSDEAELIGVIKEYKPDLIGFSMMTLSYKQNLEIIRRIAEIRNKDLGFKIILGGIFISSFKDEIFVQHEYIDYAVIGEGEHALIELCEGKPLEEIKGVIYRKDKQLSFTGFRPLTKDCDEFAFPTYTGFKLREYLPEMAIITSRGCPYSCIFCDSHHIFGKSFRPRNAKGVVDEIEYWMKRGYREFDFSDDNFTLHTDRVKQICDEIKVRHIKDVSFRIGNGVRADKVDKELLLMLKEIGLRFIAFGVEVGNDRMMTIVKKGETIEQIRKAVRDALDLKIEVTLLFLIGSPEESWKDIEDSFIFARESGAWRIRFRNIIPFPHTELYDWVKAHGRFIKQPEEYLQGHFGLEPVFDTPTLSFSERQKATQMSRELCEELGNNFLKKRFSRLGKFGNLAYKIASTNQVKNMFYKNIQFRKAAMKILSFLDRK